MALRVHELAKPSFWGDELQALEYSTGRGEDHESLPEGVVIEPGPRLTGLAEAPSWPAIWTITLANQPPLYFLVLRAWRERFGEGEAAARSLSVLCSLLALVALVAAVRVWNGTEAALWAAALMALSSAQIRYGQEARGYALLLALGMAGLVALALIERKGPSWPRLAALGACALGMALTHYFSAGALLAIAAYAAVALEAGARRRVLVTVSTALAIFFAAWGPFISFAMIGRDKNPRFFEAAGPCGIRFVGRLLRLPAAYLGGEAAQQAAWAALVGVLVWAAIAWLAVGRRELRPWTFWLLGTVGAVAMLDAVRGTVHVFVIRYTILASPAFFAIAASAGAGRRPWLVRFGAPLAALLVEVAFLSSARTRTPDPDWRTLAADLDRNAGPRDVLILAPSEDGWSGRVYEPALSHYLRTPRPFVILDFAPAPELLERLRAEPGLWLLASPGERLDRVPGMRVVSVVRRRDVPVLTRLEPEPTK